MKIFIQLISACFIFFSSMSAVAEPTDHHETEEIKAKTFIVMDLKDPESARFRNVFTKENKKEDGSISYLVCGEINAKNSYGAYVGYKPFYYSDGWGERLSSDNQETFTMMFDALCLGK